MATPAIAAHRRDSRVTAFFATVAMTIMLTAKTMIAPHKVSLANLKQIPLTIVGFACIDFAAFHLAHGWGWLVTGLSLILLEHMIAEDEA